MKGLKDKVKSIPVLGDFATKIYQKTKGSKQFTTSSDYWKNRYQSGGNSGAGSYDQLAKFKANVINDFVDKQRIDSVIEFGSGDGNQLGYFNFKNYIGYDVSAAAIEKCKALFASDPNKRFEVIDAYIDEKADAVMSLDVIYHLIEDSVYETYMKRLFTASKKYVIIYSSDDETFNEGSTAPHVKHRKFTSWVSNNFPDFKLIEKIPNKFPFNGDFNTSSQADFFIYKTDK